MATPDDSGTGVATKPKTQQKLGRPPMYRVLLHNDDYTPREFVVVVLMHVFHRSESEAVAIMLKAHTTGFAVAGVYTFEIAESKSAEVASLSKEAGFPLRATLEPESD